MYTVVCFGDTNTWGYDNRSGDRLAYDERWTGVLAKELGREATLEELSAKMKMSEDEVRDIMKLALDALTVNGEGQAAASGQDEEESPNPVRNGWNLEEGL